LTDEEYENTRMDWKSMFTFDPSTSVVRLIGRPEDRMKYSIEMFARRRRYFQWLHTR